MSVHSVRSTRRGEPLLFERQRRLLALLEVLGGRVGNLDFQKLLFLYCQEPGVDAPYEFVPYKFGAFSFTCYADRRKLVERGLLADDDLHWRLTEEGRKAARRSTGNGTKLALFASRTRNLRGEDLISETYRRFPYYATRSEIAEKVLRGDADALRRVEKTRERASSGAASILTLGYEGRTLESYLNALIRAGVTLLCDVRRNPISRKYGFSKGTLSKACNGVGIRYEHLPELGIPSEDRRSLETQADYDALFAEYERSHLPHQAAALAAIRDWAAAGERVALTCYELSPRQCHRRCVADALVRDFGSGFSPKHL